MTKIYLVRHGQTYLNKYERMQGWCDSPLTETGIQDAYNCGKALASIEFEAIYSSDSGRAIHTAELMMEKLKLKNKRLNKKPIFRETFFGSYEGEFSCVAWEKAALSKGFESPEEMMKHSTMAEITDAFSLVDPTNDAENFETFITRYCKGLYEITEAKDTKKNILVVTHGNSIRALVHHLDPQINVGVDIPNGSVTTVKIKEGKLQLVTFNQAT